MKTKTSYIKRILILSLTFLYLSFNFLCSFSNATTSLDLSSYTLTDNLTDSDKKDSTQKNYTITELDDDNYLISTAEWTDKEEGEASLTLSGSLTYDEEEGETGETEALYVVTCCYAHGLTTSILASNITYLATYYDKVTVLSLYYYDDYDMAPDINTWTSDDSEDEIKSFYDENYSGSVGSHNPMWSAYAIQTYLFGTAGDDYISEENMVNNPTAIYVSHDGYYVYDSTRSYYTFEETSGTSHYLGLYYCTEKYFNFLNEYYGDRYVTMSVYGKNSSAVYIKRLAGSYSKDAMNAWLGIFNPEYYGYASTIFNTSAKITAFNSSSTSSGYEIDNIYGADYNYDETFEALGVETFSSSTNLEYTVSDNFTINEVTATDSDGNSLTTTVSGQTVLVSLGTYTSGTEITLQIDVTCNSLDNDDWLDTAASKASLTSEATDTTIEVASTKLCSKTTSDITVKYLDYYTNEEIADETVTSNTIGNTYETESKTIEGYTLFSNSDNTSGTSDLDDITVYYYYKYNSSIIVNYIDIDNEEETIYTYTLSGLEGDSYSISYIDQDGFTYNSDSGNLTGTYTKDTITVNYYVKETTSINITKVDDEYNPLEGVVFKLYMLICTDETHDHSELIGTGDYDTSCWELIGTYTTDSNGIIYLENLLKTGTYRLVEVETVGSYILSAGEWELTFYGLNEGDENVYSIDGTLVKSVAIGEVENIEQIDDELYILADEIFTLPVTGGEGLEDIYKLSLSMILVGTIGIYYYYKNKKLNKTNKR